MEMLTADLAIYLFIYFLWRVVLIRQPSHSLYFLLILKPFLL